jgi:hypothetical protein
MTCLAASAVVAVGPSFPAFAQDNDAPSDEAVSQPQTVELSAAQLFQFADAARDRGDYETAETAYRALTENPDLELRTEARFRQAMMFTQKLGRHREAATLLRRILDDKPDASAVRLELAKVQAQLGNLDEARRELRAAQASGLPPQVEQLVRFYAAALSQQNTMGASFEVALAPSNNINRATSDDTLGTIIGDFTLDEDAQAKSGIGLSLRGQAYGRSPMARNVDLLVRLSGNADLYKDADFNDLSLSFQAGPQIRSGRDRFNVSGAVTLRWYGMDPYTSTYGATANWQHPLNDETQLRVDGSILRDNNHRNDLQDAMRYTLAASVDKAFSARAGGGLQVNGSRVVANDAGYSTASGGANAYFFRELGRTTAVLNLGYRHLEADRRLFLYPKRRIDDNFSVSLSGTFRSLSVGTFAPLVRVRYERNLSTINIYDFNRLAADFGVVAAF